MAYAEDLASLYLRGVAGTLAHRVDTANSFKKELGSVQLAGGL